jgi:peptidoglycan/LPS O-acetylase OafA/YrhL
MVAARSYAIYILHVFVLVAVQAPLVDVAIPPLAKFAIVALVGVPLSVAVAAVFRWPRSVRRAYSRRGATDHVPATS